MSGGRSGGICRLLAPKTTPHAASMWLCFPAFLQHTQSTDCMWGTVVGIQR